jgi:hypothetical protein
MINELTEKTPILRLQAAYDGLFTRNLKSRFFAQRSLCVVKPFLKVSNRGIVLFGFLASLFTLLKLDGEIIDTFISFCESL